MPIADFVHHVGGLSQNDEGARALSAGLADAHTLQAYAAGHGIALSEAEADAIIDATRSTSADGVRSLTDADLDSVNGGGTPEGLSRIMDIIHSSIVPQNLPKKP
ncbi:hypothetical protein GCM10007301_36860 [Azorhizobium oxalatiphilum]|uniref:Nif11 domain-containing protein n=1 Tax=Azorhizobium oxalatiphilum TaxID=980631 RepID=A0A917FEI6_9HYPH|nr:hypothetical protein [Azorhizobium oxalatiphilum]GGF73657.1 hypothetical protein GCM10007301_36860 [Azorhizobium oxalatiphilum]